MGFFGVPLSGSTIAGTGPSGGNGLPGGSSLGGGSGLFGGNNAAGASSFSQQTATRTPMPRSRRTQTMRTAAVAARLGTRRLPIQYRISHRDDRIGYRNGHRLSGQTFGGAGIIGFSPNSPKQSIMVYKKKNHYNEWEFVYDPLAEQMMMQGATRGASASLPAPRPPRGRQPERRKHA